MMQRKFHMWMFVAVIVLLPAGVFALVQFMEDKYQPLPVLGQKGHRVTSFRFINQHLDSISADDWKNKIVVANFFFTRCPSVCPKMTYNLKRVQAYAPINNLVINSFTVDPGRDNASRLKEFAKTFDIKGDWNLLTGNKKELYKFARKGLMITATDGDGGPEDFIHSENLVLIDTQYRIRGYYDGTDEAAVNQLIRDIGKLAAEQ